MTYKIDNILKLILKVLSYSPILLFFLLIPKWLTCLWHFDLLIGAVNNAVLSYFLKGIIKSKRPGIKNRSSYGMPSSHSAFIGYIWSFLFLEEYNDKIESIKLNNRIILLLWGLLVVYSRYHFKHHTIIQLLVGIFTGSLLAFFWTNIKLSSIII